MMLIIFSRLGGHEHIVMRCCPGILMYIECTNDYYSLFDVESILKGITVEYKSKYSFFVSGTQDFISTRAFKFYILDKHGDVDQHLYHLNDRKQKLHAFNNLLRENKLDSKYPLNGFDNMSIPPCFHLPSYVEKPIQISDDVISIEVDMDNSTPIRFPMDITHCYHNDLPLNFSPIETDDYYEDMRITCIRVIDRLNTLSGFEIHTVNDCIRNRLEYVPCISS